MSCSHLNRTESNSVRQALAKGELFNPFDLNLSKCKEVMQYSAQSNRFLVSCTWLDCTWTTLLNLKIKEQIMAQNREVYMGFPKEPKNENNQPQSHVIGETDAEFDAKVAAYTDRGQTFVGYGQVTLYKVNKAGLKAARAALTLSGLVNLNRQVKTDVRNDTARLGELRLILAKFAKGIATDAEKKKVFTAAAKGNLGKDIQTQVESMIQAALK